jgi:hypothetical protein
MLLIKRKSFGNSSKEGVQAPPPTSSKSTHEEFVISLNFSTLNLRTNHTFLNNRFFVKIYLQFTCILTCFHNKIGDTLPGLI